MGLLSRSVWDELVPPGEQRDAGARPVAYPEETTLLALFQDSASAWWDDHRTAGRESRDEMVGRALSGALRSALHDLGAPDDGRWLWRNVHHANIHHLLRLQALSALDLPVQGGA
jgi:hypothetical protein